ncbi:hypothetical protein AIZ09_23230, partial [Salmonella enterica subsp. enterica serovar Typhimurium]
SINCAQRNFATPDQVFVLALQVRKFSSNADQRHATTSNHAYFYRRTGRVQRNNNAGYQHYHFTFARSANFETRNASCPLRT